MVRTTFGVHHTFAVSCFAKKARYRRSILAKLFAKDFNGDCSMIGMLRAKDGGCTSFPHFALQRISGDRLSDEVLTWHAANLTSAKGVSQANRLLFRQERQPDDDPRTFVARTSRVRQSPGC
jgi:hypothetical protein